MTDLDAILSQLAEGHWPRPTAELGQAIVERIRGLEERLANLERPCQGCGEGRDGHLVLCQKDAVMGPVGMSCAAAPVTLTYVVRGIQRTSAAGEGGTG